MTGPPVSALRCSLPRASIHRIAFISGRPSASTGTVHSPCVLQQTAMIWLACDEPLSDEPLGHAQEGIPPRLRILLGAAVGKEQRLDALEFPGQTLP